MELTGGEGVVDLSGGGGDSPVVAELEQVDESGEKPNRNPRWLQEETLVLVEAKRRHEEDLSLSIPRSRPQTAEEKWKAIAAYCNAKNCDRTSYQCKKRWSALYGDYKKVREWQSSNSQSYWSMKNDRRREDRLPGTFDRVVFSSMHNWLKKDSDADFHSPSSRPPDEALSSEIEQDAEGQDLPDIIRGDGNSIPRSDQTGDLGDKRYRNPRWSLTESLILLAAKKKQEDDYGMVPKARLRTISADERWGTISVFCRSQGYDRNAYQCRKRWSALLGDFRRIREWQKTNREVYWLMKNERRKENKLPAIFDHEVFANMESWVGKRSAKKSGTGSNGLIDSARPAANGGQLSDVDNVQDGHLEPDSPLGGCQRNTILPPEFGSQSSIRRHCFRQQHSSLISKSTIKESIESETLLAKFPQCFKVKTVLVMDLQHSVKYFGFNERSGKQGTSLREEMPSDSTARKKRKRAVNGDTANDYKAQQLAAIFKSSVMAMQETLAETTKIQIQAHHSSIQAQIEAQNLNSQLDRMQRKEQGELLVGVLGKLAEAVSRIAERLV